MLKSLYRLASFIAQHPLTRNHQLAAWLRFIRWQVGSRIIKFPVLFPWINQSNLIIERGMVGATGNLYCGLHEFDDMGFLLHFLRQEDLFIDVGANIGSYTVLAASVKNSSVLSFEPIPATYARLMANIRANPGARVTAINEGLGAENEILLFSANLDAENHVLPNEEGFGGESIAVKVRKLDDVTGDLSPIMIKIDVEGFESQVIQGGLNTISAPSLLVILIELNGLGSRYGYSEDSIKSTIVDYGFTPNKYDPLTRSLIPISIVGASNHGNILFIRDIDKVQERLTTSLPFNVLGRSI